MYAASDLPEGPGATPEPEEPPALWTPERQRQAREAREEAQGGPDEAAVNPLYEETENPNA